MKIQKLSIFLIVLSSFFIGVSAVSADSVDIEQKVNSINLNWNLEGESYKVYRDGKLIWEGTDNSLIDDNLEPSSQYLYKIGAFNSDGLIDLVSISTSTQKPKAFNIYVNDEDGYSEIYNAWINSEVSQDYISLSWTELKSDNNEYIVYRNGIEIDRVKDRNYTDTNIEPGKTYVYQIDVERKVTGEIKKEIEESIVELNLEVSDEDKKELLTERDKLIKVVDTPKAFNKRELKEVDTFANNNSLSSIDYTFLFQYTTFIGERRVEEPLGNGWLGGDDRSFDYWSNKYRTRSIVEAGWGPMGPTNGLLNLSRFVGESILYETEFGSNILNRGTASTSGITINKLTHNDTEKRWIVDHKVGIPFGNYPNIDYGYDGLMQKNNYMWSLVGFHDKAPHHEIAIAVANTDLEVPIVYSYVGENFFELLPVTPKERYSISK